MKRKNLGRLTAVLILAFAAGLSAYAQGQGRGQGQGQRDPFGGRLFAPNVVLQHQDELELTDAQRQQIRELVISTQTEVSENQWDMREAYREVMSVLDEPTIDEAAVTDLIEVVLETENRVKTAQIMMLIRLRNLLTPEQVSILRESSRREGDE